MRVESIRRWPLYVMCSMCFLLLFTLFNSWTMQTVLENKIANLSKHLQECLQQQSSCMEESLKLQVQRDLHVSKIYVLEQEKVKLSDEKSLLEEELGKAETQVNKTIVDLGYCKAELQSQKNLQVRVSAALEDHHLKKATLTSQLAEKNTIITMLEKEVSRLKLALTTRSAPVSSVSAKVTPATASTYITLATITLATAS